MRLALIFVLILGVTVTITAASSADITFPQISPDATPNAASIDHSRLALVARNECSDKCDLNDGPCLLKCMDDNDKKCLAGCSHDSNFYPCVSACVGKVFPGSQGLANTDILQPERHNLCFDNAICYNTCESRSFKYCKVYCNYEYYWNCQHTCGADCPSFIERTSTTLIRKVSAIAAPQLQTRNDSMRSVSTIVTTDPVLPTKGLTLSLCADRCDPGDSECLRNVIDTCSDLLIYFCKTECGSLNDNCVMDCVEGLYAATLPMPDSAWSPPLTSVECFAAANGDGTRDHGRLTTYTAIPTILAGITSTPRTGDFGHLTTYTAIPTVLATFTPTPRTGDHGQLPTITAAPTVPAATNDGDRISCMNFCCNQALEHFGELENCVQICLWLHNMINPVT